NSAGQQIGTSDDEVPGVNRDPRLTRTLAPGTYYVGISGAPNRLYNPDVAGSGVSSSPGPYTLMLSAPTLASGSWNPTISATAQYDRSAVAGTFGRFLV